MQYMPCVKDVHMFRLCDCCYRDSDSESDDGRAGLITPFESLEITSTDQRGQLIANC